MITGMHHAGVVVLDLDRAVEFYSDAVGLNPNPPKDVLGDSP